MYGMKAKDAIDERYNYDVRNRNRASINSFVNFYFIFFALNRCFATNFGLPSFKYGMSRSFLSIHVCRSRGLQLQQYRCQRHSSTEMRVFRRK